MKNIFNRIKNNLVDMEQDEDGVQVSMEVVIYIGLAVVVVALVSYFGIPYIQKRLKSADKQGENMDKCLEDPASCNMNN